ncbi:MAG: thioesterase, partial [Chlamydiia bacterium]|nr:thioesterase [Chlamydiia bacterium]
TAESFASWGKELGADMEPLYVRLPGRGIRFFEQAFDDLPKLVEALLPELASIADQPFSFFGHSMGALIAFELAHAAKQELGVEPAFLFLSGHRAPCLPNARKRLLHTMDEGSLHKALVEMGGLGESPLSAEDLAPFMPTLYHDFKLCETYRYEDRQKLNSHAVILYGLDDPWIQADKLELWQNEFSQEIELCPFSGGHFYLNHHPSAVIDRIHGRLQTQNERRKVQ